MSAGVEFDEDKFSYGNRPKYPSSSSGGSVGYASYGNVQSSGSGMAGWLVRKGWAKSPESAQKMMIALVIINIVVTYIVITYFIL